MCMTGVTCLRRGRCPAPIWPASQTSTRENDTLVLLAELEGEGSTGKAAALHTVENAVPERVEGGF